MLAVYEDCQIEVQQHKLNVVVYFRTQRPDQTFLILVYLWGSLVGVFDFTEHLIEDCDHQVGLRM